MILSGGMIMKKRRMILTVAIMAALLTACGNGDGVVINGTKAEDVESVPEGGSQDSSGDTGQGESKGNTKIEIITGETQPVESAAESTEGQTEAFETQAPTAAPTTAPPATAAPTTAAPTTAAPTTAAPQYKVTDVKKNMYATSSVRVRSNYSTSSEVLGALEEGEKVEVTGESSNGWMRVNYKGHVAYVSKSYLTDTQPTGTTTTTNTNTGTNTTTNQSTKPSSTTNTGTTPGGTSGPTGPGGTGSGGTTPGGTNGPTGPGGTGSGGTTPGGTSGPTGPGGTTSNFLVSGYQSRAKS